jgi:phage tail-like protein
MGILLTTDRKKKTAPDPFSSGKFSKIVVQAKPDASKPAPAEDVPFPAYLCSVMIDNKIVGLFQKFSDIEVKRDLEAFSQGGENDHTQELAKGLSYAHVTLRTGYSTSKLLMDWMFAGQYDARPIIKNIDVVQGRPNPETGKPDMGRKWTFHNAFPVKWKLQDFDVDDTEKFLIETIEFTFEYFTVLDLPPAGSPPPPPPPSPFPFPNLPPFFPFPGGRPRG